MLTRTMTMIALALLCLLAGGCPQENGEDQPAAPEPSEVAQAAKEQAAPPKEIVPRPNPVTTISKLYEAMNAGDRDSFALLIHPDAPVREELLGRFDNFDNERARINLEDATIRSQTDLEATVLYDSQTHFSDGETKPDFDTGWFKLRFEGGSWLIWSFNKPAG